MNTDQEVEACRVKLECESDMLIFFLATSFRAPAYWLMGLLRAMSADTILLGGIRSARLAAESISTTLIVLP